MQTISKSKLKPQMLRVFREIEESGESHHFIVDLSQGHSAVDRLQLQFVV